MIIWILSQVGVVFATCRQRVHEGIRQNFDPGVGNVLTKEGIRIRPTILPEDGELQLPFGQILSPCLHWGRWDKILMGAL